MCTTCNVSARVMFENLQWESFQETLSADTLKASRIRWPKVFAAPVSVELPPHDRKQATFKTGGVRKAEFVVLPTSDPLVTVVL